MAKQPAGDAQLTDEDLDEAVQSMFEDESEAPTAAPAAETTGPVESDETPDTQAPDKPAAGDETPATDVAAQPAPETSPAASAPAAPVEHKPFQFKASGRDHTLPWASELPDGSVVIPKEQRQEFQRELASARELQTNFRNIQRERDRERVEWKTQRTAKDVEADASIALMAELITKSPEEQWQYLNEFKGNIPRLQHDLREKQLKEREQWLEQQAKGPQLSEEEQREQFTETVRGELNATFQWIEQDPQFALLTPTERQQLRARWEKKPERLVRRAPEDNPAQGITKGDYLFDPSEVVEDIQFIIGNRKASQPSKAAEQNARRNADQQVTNRIPPTPKAAAPTNQQPRDHTGKFTDRKQFRKDFLADDDEAA
jgi:hypothetical protein